MKKHLNNFPEHSISIESYNDLLNPCYDSILQFGDRVLVAKTNWKGGVEAAVYGFAEDPREGLSSIECRLELLKISDEVFTDAGHAMEWCIRNAHRDMGGGSLRGAFARSGKTSVCRIYTYPTRLWANDRVS